VGSGIVADVVFLTCGGVEDVLQVDGVEDDDGVGDEGEAERLFGLLLVVAPADVALRRRRSGGGGRGGSRLC
jgi:hypothetical protein